MVVSQWVIAIVALSATACSGKTSNDTPDRPESGGTTSTGGQTSTGGTTSTGGDPSAPKPTWSDAGMCYPAVAGGGPGAPPPAGCPCPHSAPTIERTACTHPRGV